MADGKTTYVGWNPWHGCTKISTGCKYCYVYRQDAMYGSEKSSSEVTKNADYALPVRRKRDKTYKIESGSIVFTCFTSDFLVEGADRWRDEAWAMIKERDDCMFFFFTKRIDRLEKCLPTDWGEGYDNVIVGCTVENQDRADFRLPLLKRLPIKHKTIIIAPMLEPIDLSAFLDQSIEEVSVSGESGLDARVCNYDWVLAVREQCMARKVPFSFHQTGAKLIRNGRLYHIPRRFQIAQARKANIDYLIGDDMMPLRSKP